MMLKLAMTTGLASLFVVGVMSLSGCPGGAAGEGEGEGEGQAGEGEGQAGEGEGEGEGGGDEFCQEACTQDSDCTVAGGTDIFFHCDTTSHRCTGDACASDGDCDARFVGATVCHANGDCTGGHCINLDQSGATTTEGRCDSIEAVAGNCAQGTKVTLNDIGGQPIDVCTFFTETCDTTTNLCRQNDCASDNDCSAGTPKCDTASTHKCVECLATADCAGNTAGTKCYLTTNTCGCNDSTECGAAGTAPSVCNATTGACNCASSAECTGSHDGDVCNADGTCGCAASTDCTGTEHFDNTTFECAAQ